MREAVTPAGSLSAEHIGQTVRFTVGGATYEGQLTTIQHARHAGITDDPGPGRTLLAVTSGRWFTSQHVDIDSPVTLVPDPPPSTGDTEPDRIPS